LVDSEDTMSVHCVSGRHSSMWKSLSSLFLALLFAGSILPPVRSEFGHYRIFQHFAETSRPFIGSPVFQVAEKKPTVILVHGYPTKAVLTADSRKNDECSLVADKWQPGTQSDFEFLPEWLVQDGYRDIRMANYQSGPGGTPDIEINAACLRSQVINAAEESATGDVVIIAYSLGGLVTRAYLESEQYRQDIEVASHPLVSKVFLVGTPNHGMPFNSFINLLYDCSNPDSVQRAACQFTSTELMQEFNAKYTRRAPNVDYYLIGGVHYSGLLGTLMGTYICADMGPNDGTVPTSSATELDGVRQAVTVYASHLSVVGSPSYFGPDAAGSQTAAYKDCIYPVLAEGNPDGCHGNVPYTCEPSSLGIGIVIVGLFAVGLWALVFQIVKRRKINRSRKAL
jgi:hypothetical protein